MKILTDLHTHTNTSDHGFSTLLENATQANKKGLQAIALTNHGPAIEDGTHRWHYGNMIQLPRVIENVTVIRGMEANILNSTGKLDYDEMDSTDQAGIELLIASCHGGVYQPSSTDEFLELYTNLCKRDDIHILGHLCRYQCTSHLDKIIPLANSKGILIELNALSYKDKRYHENNIRLIDACLKYNAQVCINTDTHFCYDIGDLNGMDKYLEEINFPQELVMNRDLPTLLDYFKLEL
ncbi:MAG: PHP domain-containing protein [Clostridiales bacterium]|jgi:putative hydrolase|nr:PHP domain-containing protein [Clostridiales bacterium]